MKRASKDTNVVFLVGEVVDLGVSPTKKGISARARIKVRASKEDVYLDVYGRRSCAEAMTLICHTGNIVYVEGEFKSNSSSVYVSVTRIECLLRRRDVTPPDVDVIEALNMMDPIGYFNKEEK